MTKFKLFPLFLATLFPFFAQAKLNVVATIPDFGAIAEVIGEGEVKVTTLAKGTEDAHFIDPKPSYIRVLNQADVLLEGGADLEVGWLPTLISSARNAKILDQGKGRVRMSQGVHLLDVPTGPIDRSMGDVHPLGNSHYWLDPANGKAMARHITEVLSRLEPNKASLFEANLKQFETNLDRKMVEWKKRLEPYRGTKVITYHKSFDYFVDRFGLVLAGTIEPKPGVEPSPTHIKALIAKTKEENVKLVLVEPFRPRKTPENVAENVGATLVVLSDKVGGHEKAKDYFSLFDYNVSQIVQALSR
jgi:zinc/manganese transport system substrate-binding protein